MKDKTLEGLELICKRYSKIKTKIIMESLTHDAQIEFKKMQKEMPELKLHVDNCVKCDEMSIVTECINLS